MTAGTRTMLSGQDYTLSGTVMGILQAGVWHRVAVYVNNYSASGYSGTVACPAIAAGASLVALCWQKARP